MNNGMFCDSEMKLQIVEIEKQKQEAAEAIFFEIDILIQMMRALNMENVKGYSLEITAMSINPGSKIGENFSMKCVLPIESPKELKDELLSVETSMDVHQQMDARERLMLKYAIMTTEATFFNNLWKGNKAVTCRFIIDMVSGESMKIGPFKMIDLVRDFKR